MEKIEKIYPDLQLVSIGESDFIVDYIRQKKKSRVWQGLMVAFVSVFTFVGSAYAIMAYNNDVSTNEIFEKVYESEHRSMYSLRTSEHRSMYSYVRLSIDRYATYV